MSQIKMIYVFREDMTDDFHNLELGRRSNGTMHVIQVFPMLPCNVLLHAGKEAERYNLHCPIR